MKIIIYFKINNNKYPKLKTFLSLLFSFFLSQKRQRVVFYFFVTIQYDCWDHYLFKQQQQQQQQRKYLYAYNRLKNLLIVKLKNFFNFFIHIYLIENILFSFIIICYN